MEDLWKISIHYDNGDSYEMHDAWDDVEYVQGTADDVHKYLMKVTGYDPNNLVDFDIAEHRKVNCDCPQCIEHSWNPSVPVIKATPSKREGYDERLCNEFAFHKEGKDESEIIYAFVRQTYESHDNPKYDTWDTNEYIATPTTLDQIVKVL